MTDEEKKAYFKQHYQANLERARAYRRAYAAAHTTEAKARRLKWLAKHGKAHKAARDAAYYKANAERIKAQVVEYRRTHPEVWRSTQRKRRAAVHGAESTLTRAQWEARLAAYGYRCAYCGAHQSELEHTLEQDHVVPLSRGGAHTLENVVPACRSCNAQKNARTPEEWR